MTTYLDKTLAKRANPPQSRPLDSTQVKNSAGGYVYKIDDFARLRRFLILGSEGGTYYAGESKLTLDNLDAVERCIKQDGIETVRIIIEVSQGGRAPKNDQAILALALCIAHGDERTKQAALTAVPLVARIGTHLFQLVEFLNKLGSLSGRAKRRAISNWYLEKDAEDLAYQVIKYRNRAGWTHRDVLRVAHPQSQDVLHSSLFEWIVRGNTSDKAVILPAIIGGFEMAQAAKTPEETAALVRDFGLPREALKTEHLTSPEVWQALLDADMPLTAMIRNLGNMTRIGLLTAQSEATKTVVKKIKNAEVLKRARVHPLTILNALATYQAGHGFRGGNSWTPVTKIIDALDAAFYMAFGNVESTNKRVLIGLDVSGSMGAPLNGSMLSCRTASAAMAMVTEHVETAEVVGFTSGGWNPDSRAMGYYRTGVHPLNISSRQRLDDVVRSVSRLNFGATDCALPMIYARQNNKPIDLFVVYTDNETWHGSVHPATALKDYRKASGIDAKLVVVGMTATEFSIADPKDSGMLDVVGFDSATPQIISDFGAGRI